MKRLIALLVVLSLALAQGTLPRDARFDQPVSNIGTNLPLPALLDALARSVGLSPILRDIPNVNVTADIDQKPFRQVWDLLINTYGDGRITYALLDNNVIVVGPKEVVDRARGQTAQPAQTSEPVAREFYQVRSGDPAALATFVQQEVPGVTVRAVPGQNVLSISGPSRAVNDALNFLQRIDVPRATTATIPVVQKSFALSHARATELADVLGKAITAQAQGQTTPAQGQGQGQAQPAPQVTVVAEPRTNTLIVTGTAEQIALAERLIPNLDRPVQQVQLQIRVQAVSGEVIRNLGIKWETVSGGNLIASFLSTGLNLIFDATRSLASLNIRAVLDALEKQQLSRRLSDANVLVEDNYGADTSDLRATGAKGAEIKVGGRLLIPITIGDQITVREFDYGLLVRVRPQISTDGNILLEVFTQTGGDPADGPAGSIRIPQQSTLSKLRIRDGQTVVLGGLIQKVTDTSETKIPLLGDIPLLGELFKQRTSSIKDDELIVIITGNIVKDSAQR
ncbi:secretin N-terminal domain-containing protein [Meiothermus ruber]|jgi:general secretion pathway protein D/type IV pilus assembly protein PilQ|uniref:Type II and III secretion system protein n=1 Tax=Meiothermus ruber (strain ATCC 35948 / DSM 1279 / VKM B-1258 / 21) TaxID=504728 RepID=D3PNU6_MEIRD|nr:secretin N-terminal domain-containing protein [Meiothermus ruber]ADD29491.1 type II and III secretion system protein [Meiothermus ruber DSM 1279]AGK05059.1 type II and III secretion system protein [Meiothermus ruber DSM 1279]MCL6529299.1 type II and III secretion system protein [Meiothermus ruber]GAO76413.1 type II and III secretion system protein [Meiothermus ruber H328]